MDLELAVQQYCTRQMLEFGVLLLEDRSKQYKCACPSLAFFLSAL
jgi:hypothetical protein